MHLRLFSLAESSAVLMWENLDKVSLCGLPVRQQRLCFGAAGVT